MSRKLATSFFILYAGGTMLYRIRQQRRRAAEVAYARLLVEKQIKDTPKTEELAEFHDQMVEAHRNLVQQEKQLQPFYAF